MSFEVICITERFLIRIRLAERKEDISRRELFRSEIRETNAKEDRQHLWPYEGAHDLGLAWKC